MVEIPDSLVERLKARQAVLVTGFGCGELAGSPGWRALAELLAGRLVFSDARDAVVKLMESGRLGDAVAFMRDQLPPTVVEEVIQQAFPGGAAIPDGVKMSAEFPWRVIVTTTFDDLWQRALTAVGEAKNLPDPSPAVLVADSDPAQIPNSGPPAPLLHLFGRVAQPESLCVGAGDARTQLVSSPALTWLDHVRRRRSLVLVGFRPTDPDLIWFSSWLAARPSYGVPHFLFLDVSGEPDPDTLVSIWAVQSGLEVIPCTEGTAEGLGRLARIANSIGARLPPSESLVDIDAWLNRWEQNPGDPEPRLVLARVEAALRDEERWDRLVELLLRRLDLQDDKDEQMAALTEVAQIFRELLDAPERALTAEVAMLRLAPTDDALWAKLHADARAAGACEQLVAGAIDVATQLGATAEAARIWREIALVQIEDLENIDDALVAYREALAADPGRRDVLDEQVEILRHLERWQELVSVLRTASGEANDPERAVALMQQAAELLESKLGDVEGAVAAHQAVLAMAPETDSAALALERLYEKEKRWADLAEVLDKRARRSPPAVSAALRRRRAEILADDLDALDQAAEELEALLAEDPELKDKGLLSLLEQIYQRAENHDDYLRTLQRQADASPNPPDRLAILRRLATEGETRPDGLDRAAEALEQILRLEPRDTDAFFALERIYRGAGRPVELTATLSRRLEVTETADSRRELLFELAEAYDQDLDEPERALEAYAASEKAGDHRKEIYEAIARLAERLERWDQCTESLQKWAEIAPDDPRALATLARIQNRNGDHERAAATYLDAAEHEPSAAAQSGLLTEAAIILQDHLHREEPVVELYTKALDADATNATAAERLSELYAARGRWAEVETLLDSLAGKLAGSMEAGSAERQVAVEMRLADARIALGNSDKALDCLARAHDISPQSLPVLRKYADLRATRKEWTEALALYETLQKLHGSGLPPADAFQVAMAIGRCHDELGNREQAVAQYKLAKELQSGPEQRPAIEALAAAYAAKEDWTAWVADQQELAAVAPAEDKARLWEEIADACAGKLNDRARAEEMYRRALEAEPKRRTALYKLLDIYTKDQRWPQAIEMLSALSQAEEDRAVRARTLYTAALISRDELDKPGEAAGFFERCLDESPEMTIAFEELEALLKGADDWSGLAHCYGRMLKRLGTDGPVPLRLNLWGRLGDVAMKRLRDKKMAMTAYEAAAELDPGDLTRQEQLAHIYEVIGPETREQAIAAHQRLIARDPHRTDSYRALAKLYGDLNEIDKQWCVAAALYHLKKIDPAMDSLFKRFRPPQVRPTQRPFSEEIWQRVTHPEEDRLLDTLFGLCAPFLAAPAAKAPNAVGLGRQKAVDFERDRSVLISAVVHVAGAMGLPTPDLFLVDGENFQSTPVNLQLKGRPKIALVLGPSTQRRNSFDLVFDLATQMAFLRPQRFLKFAFGTPAAIELGIQAALAVGGGPAQPAAMNGEAGRLTAYLQKTVPAPLVSQITEAGRALVEARGEKIDVVKWIGSTDMSAARAALVLTGDLGAAARVIMNEPTPTSPVSAQKRLADLIAFSISDDHFACRKLLGLQVI